VPERPLQQNDAPAARAAIEVRGLGKRYASPGALPALDRIDLTVHEGEFFGLLGPNGAGKTTLISILAGLTRASAGSARILGHDVVRDYRAARRLLGVVPQELVFDPFFSVRETLRLQSGYYGLYRNDDWIDELIASLGLRDQADTNLRALSGGMKRRVLVAQALVHRPPVVVLDEPTAGVDVGLREGLWQFVRRLNRAGHTIVLTTHYLEEAEALCGRIAMLKQGRIVALDTTANLLRSLSRKTLRLRIDPDRLPPALAALPHQRDAHDAGVWLVSLSDYCQVEPALAALRETGAGIRELEIRQPDLQDVFLEVMERA
jgi:ABC-2 type transport system ATP-binding protein